MPIEITREQQELRSRLKSDTRFHDKIKALAMDRARFSDKHISQRYERWRDAEKQHLAYLNEGEKDKEGKLLQPFDRSIVVPYSYALLQTRLTFFFLAFASNNPIVPVQGVGPKDIAPAKFMELIQSHQMSETQGLAVLYSWLQDAERYGVGFLKNVWHETAEMRWVSERQPVTILGLKIRDRYVREKKKITSYEGNLPINVSPYNAYPDPRVAVHDIKHMEFFGHQFHRSYNWLKQQEKFIESYFNIDAIPLKSTTKVFEETNTTEGFNRQNRNQSALPEIVGTPSLTPTMTVTGGSSSSGSGYVDTDRGFISLIEMWVRVIPKEFKLSDSSDPEEWLITVANGDTVVKCEPSIYSELPFFALEPNPDHQSPFNLGTMEMTKGLQDHLSWLYNSHADNVRKIINDSLIVDPSAVVMDDLVNNAPAKIIRLKETAYASMGRNRPITDYIQQLQVNDITRFNMQDADQVIGLMQRTSATPDNVMGIVEEVKRTATETSSTIELATSRLKLTAKLYSILGVVPWYKAMGFNSQGLMTEDRYYRITDILAQEFGYDPKVIENRILIRPEDAYGNFDYQYPTLDLPLDKANLARAWQEVLGAVAQNPALQQKFDQVAIFKRVLYNLGISNFSEFEVRVESDEQVAREAERGNLAPVNELLSGSANMEELSGRLNAEFGSPNGLPTLDQRQANEGV